jgi:hypothetical protein
MGQVLHGCATTTEAIRRAIQKSQESLRTLAKRHGINPKTVGKWKKRDFTADLPTGPKEAKSTSLSLEDEAIVVAFRKHNLVELQHHCAVEDFGAEAIGSFVYIDGCPYRILHPRWREGWDRVG